MLFSTANHLPRHTLILIAALAGLLLPPLAVAQQLLPKVTQISEADNDFVLDGDLDEEVWKDLPIIDGMKVIDPDTLLDAPYETHFRMFYTERGIYISAMNFQPPGTLVARMTSRDTRLARDGIVVGIDPSGQGLYGYFLRLNLGESMTDGTILPERQLNMQWDGSWNGRTTELENGWSAEMYIPWSMMALPQGANTANTVGFYFERQVGHLNGDAWSNPPLPSTVNEYLSAFTKYEMDGIQPRRQLTYFPFIGGVHDDIRHEDTYKVGTDIYWRPTTNTQLSATINPDFGSIQADDVIVNLTAFEQFFPEQRDFFLEGQDIFITHPRHSNPGGPGGPIQLVNTRRIGGAPILDVPDGVDVIPTDLSQPTDLLGAVKFTGQQGKLRYGTLIASEDTIEVEGTLDDGSTVNVESIGRDFFVGRLLYEDTNAGGRRSIGWMGTSVDHPDIDETVNAIDAHYFSADSRFIIDSSLMRSDKNSEVGYGGMADFRFRPERGKQHTIRATYFDEDLDINELGFLSRNDQMNLDYNYNRFESDIAGLRSRNTTYIFTNQWNVEGKPVRVGLFLNQDYNFLNNDTFSFSARLFPKRIDDRLGRGTGDFEVPQREGLNVSYSTDPAKPLALNAGIDWGTDTLGPAQVTSRAGVVWRPTDRFSSELNLQYTDQEALLIHRGDGAYTSFEAHQWAPNLELNYFIGPRQQIRFTMQYNGLKAFEDRFWQSSPTGIQALTPVAKPNATTDNFVISRMTFQARYRWEIAPISDLFLVYTRGSNIPSDGFDTYSDLFARTWNQPIVNNIAFRLRYRFGS